MRLLLAALIAVNTLVVSAQGPTSPVATNPPATAAPAPPPAAPPASAPGSPGFTYNAAGRRDPFVSLVGRGGAGGGQMIGGPRPAGLGGLDTAEVTLTGTIQSQSGYVGILLGADKKTYIVRAGDRLFDGTVRSITPDALVILQHVNDPLSREPPREVRKLLRQIDEAK